MLEREGSATRVVIVSASEDGPTIYRAFAHGARAYIPKVSSGDLLCSTLLRVATRRERDPALDPVGPDAGAARAARPHR